MVLWRFLVVLAHQPQNVTVLEGFAPGPTERRDSVPWAPHLPWIGNRYAKVSVFSLVDYSKAGWPTHGNQKFVTSNCLFWALYIKGHGKYCFAVA